MVERWQIACMHYALWHTVTSLHDSMPMPHIDTGVSIAHDQATSMVVAVPGTKGQQAAAIPTNTPTRSDSALSVSGVAVLVV
jgi:hypothetical protein